MLVYLYLFYTCMCGIGYKYMVLNDFYEVDFRNTTITNFRPIHGTVRKSHIAFTVTWHLKKQ